MATLRAMRLLQSIESKNTNTAALEALLTGNLSRQSDLPLLFSQRAATARILAAETFPVILGSASAAAGLSNSILAMTVIAASVSAMTMVVASSTATTAMVASDIGAGIVLGSRAVYTATIGAVTQASGIQTPWVKQWRWPARSVPSLPSQVYCAAIHPTTGVIFGPTASTNYVFSSSDGGVTWTSNIVSGLAAGNSYRLSFAAGLFIGMPFAGGTNTVYASSSATGAMAAGATVPNAAYSKAVSVGSMVVAVPISISGTACVYSSAPTGGAYSAGVMPSSQYWGDVAASSTTFVSVAGGAYVSTTVAATSANGAAWTARTLPSSQMWRSVTAGSGLDDGKFMAVGNSAAAAYSANHGVTWASVTLPAGNWGRIVYHALSRAWIAFDSVVAKCATSTNDGATWTTRTIPAVLGNTDVSAGGNYVISSSNNAALYVNF